MGCQFIERVAGLCVREAEAGGDGGEGKGREGVQGEHIPALAGLGGEDFGAVGEEEVEGLLLTAVGVEVLEA